MPLSDNAVDIVIPFRNESVNLTILQDSLNKLILNQGDQCVLVDDASEDGGAELIKETERLRLISVEESRGKKDALMAGIASGTNKYILTSDADCLHKPGWVSAMRAYLQPGTTMLIGPVIVRRATGFINWLQFHESIVLLFITKTAAEKGFAFLCSGANLMFSRNIFYKVGGYSSHLDRLSGDDVLLLRSFRLHSTDGIYFADDAEACVYTLPVSNFRDWFQQRIRWAGKRQHLGNWKSILYSIWLVAELFLPLVLLVYFWPIGVIIPFLEYPFMLRLAARYGQSFYIGDWFFFRFVYPLTVISIPIARLFMKGTWKGRRLR